MLISVFSPLWFIMFGCDAAIVVGLSILLRKRSADQKARVMMIIGICNLVYWVFYKVMLAKDPTFEFILATELPFQLCNLNMIMIVVAMNWRKPALLNFCYCFGIIGAVLALLAPDPGFVNVRLLHVRGYGYWITHHILICQSIMIVSTGFYRPKYKDLLKSMLILLVLYFAMYFINLILRNVTGLPINYLYTFGMPGNPIIEMLYRILPVYPIYLVPALVALTPVMMGLIALGRIGEPCPDAVQS